MLKIFKRQVFPVAVFLITLFISKFIKFAPIMGVLKGNFLSSQVLLPVSGNLFGGVGLISIFILSALNSLSFKFSLYSLATVYHVPSFFASLSLFLSKNRFVSQILGSLNYIIPAFCAILFIVNPVGSQVPLYTLYWAIPVVIYLSGTKNMFLNSLKATFLAHAVGTVIFIYSIDSSVNLWLNLAKIVWLERLIIASGMTLVYKVILFARIKLLELRNLVILKTAKI